MFNHYTVLKNEVIDSLEIKKDGVYVDATAGGGGHSKSILSHLSTNGLLVCFDQDEVAIKHLTEKFKGNKNVLIIKSNFKNLAFKLEEHNILKIDGIVFDLGLSSMQIDEAQRGFSYMNEGKLDMRMDQNISLTAFDIVNTYSEQELRNIFNKYGEERFSSLYAKAIIDKRAQREIISTLELSELIKKTIPDKFKYKLTSHPAKRVFQALRIEVNNELNFFESTLQKIFNLLKLNGIISIITFHSLEDKICKYYFKKYSTLSEELNAIPEVPENLLPIGIEVNNKPILPSKEELAENSRSNSAKLRVFKKVRDEDI
ncbi:MAG: 16S rRNA (cytosine(1402)-N(4))-methyltransferase RsmH [Mycoplasmatales bacterium]